MNGADSLVSLVIPAYNEAGIIRGNLGVLVEFMRSVEDEIRWEIVLVNDGSKDETGKLAEEFALTCPQMRVIHHGKNLNLGQGLRTGFANARGETIVVLDLDLSYTPDHVLRLVRHMRETHADVVIASPYMPGGKAVNVPSDRLWMSRVANRFISFVAPGKISTFTGMVRAYNTEFIRSLSLKAIGMEINMEIIYKAITLRARIEEIPSKLEWRRQDETPVDVKPKRKSHMSVPWHTLATLFSGFIFRPFLFFFIPGALVLMFALYAMVWFLLHFLTAYKANVQYSGFFQRCTESVELAYVDNSHTFVVGGVALILAVQLISLGILSMQNKRYFEEVFYLGTSIYKNQQRSANAERNEHE